jgi:hypothetical protein
VIRVKKMDTFEHITEFASAADHTLSLQKWLEMGIPLTTPQLRQHSITYTPGSSNRSVFEDAIDSTAASEATDSTENDARWKFSGPWLAGQTQGEFNVYVQKEVRRRKHDFLKFLRGACSVALSKEYRERRASADRMDELELPPQPEEVTDEQFGNYVKSLRQDWTELYKQIRIFLDIPPASKPVETAFLTTMSTIFSQFPQKQQDTTVSASPYRESGPPKTHPSAGLSYSRTTSALYNHPVFGPQHSKPPVEARIISPRGATGGYMGPALGVGGFVTSTPQDESFSLLNNRFGNRKNNTPLTPIVPGLLNVEPDKKGGSKVYVQPKFATVDPKGRVVLRVDAADPEAVDVKEGNTDYVQSAPPPPRNISPTGFSRKLELDGAGTAGFGLDK